MHRASTRRGLLGIALGALAVHCGPTSQTGWIGGENSELPGDDGGSGSSGGSGGSGGSSSSSGGGSTSSTSSGSSSGGTGSSGSSSGGGSSTGSSGGSGSADAGRGGDASIDSGTADAGGDAGTVRYNANVAPVLQNACTNACHGGCGGLQISYQNIVNVKSGEVASLNYITPNDPGRSYLFCKVSPSDSTCTSAGTAISGQRMPPGGALPATSLNTIKSWIQQGALQ